MISHLLLVLLLPVYVNLVKELFPYALFHVVITTVFPKASAKVLHFRDMAKFFRDYFLKKMHFYGLDDRNQGKSEIFGEYERTFEKMREMGREASRTRLDRTKKEKGEPRTARHYIGINIYSFYIIECNRNEGRYCFFIDG